MFLARVDAALGMDFQLQYTGLQLELQRPMHNFVTPGFCIAA